MSMDKDEYTEAWGEDAIQPPVEGSLQAEAKKKAMAEQAEFDQEFASLAAKEDVKE